MNKHFENIIKNINRHKRGLRDPQIMHPEREWSIGIFLAVLVFVSSASWSLALYLENRDASANVAYEEQSESVVYREAMVAEALQRLDSRSKVLESLVPQESGQQLSEEVAMATTTDEVASSSLEIVEDVSTSTEETGE